MAKDDRCLTPGDLADGKLMNAVSTSVTPQCPVEKGLPREVGRGHSRRTLKGRSISEVAMVQKKQTARRLDVRIAWNPKHVLRGMVKGTKLVGLLLYG